MPLTLTILILLAIVVIIAGFKIYILQREVLALSKELEAEKKEFAEVAVYNERQKEIKNQNKAKVMTLFERQKKISNNDVQKKLGISSVTAFRYLEELEKEGKLKQNNKFGRMVHYTKVDQ